MTEIPLSQEFVALVDDEDAALVADAGPWHAYNRRGRSARYAIRHTRRADGRRTTQFLHAFLTGYAQTDHVNGDGLDNRRENLRQASTSQNQHNAARRRDNTSGYKGVSWHKGNRRWDARIMLHQRSRSLGQYATAEEAARAYDAAARELHGEFARLNFPDGES